MNAVTGLIHLRDLIQERQQVLLQVEQLENSPGPPWHPDGKANLAELGGCFVYGDLEFFELRQRKSGD